MSGPAKVDQVLWQGDDSPPMQWGFGPVGTSEIPAGAQFRLDIGWIEQGFFVSASATGPISGQISASSPNGLTVDYGAGTVTWPYTTAQSASIPRGPGVIVGYMLRCLYQGATQTWAYGRITAKSGLPLAVPE